MVKLTKMKCVACRSDVPQVDGDEMAEYGEQVPDWKIVRREGINRLERNFEFPDFVQAMAFTNQVGVLAEEEDHHARSTPRSGVVQPAPLCGRLFIYT